MVPFFCNMDRIDNRAAVVWHEKGETKKISPQTASKNAGLGRRQEKNDAAANGKCLVNTERKSTGFH